MSIDKDTMDYLRDLAIDKGIPMGPKLDATLELFDQYIHYNGSEEQPQKVVITQDGVKRIHITNLRFQFGPFIMATLGFAAKYAPDGLSNLDNITLARIWLVLSYLAEVKKLTEIKITDTAAEILIGIYRLLIEQEPVTRESIKKLLPGQVTEAQFDEALKNLETLGVLSREGELIEIKEEITA